MTAESPLACDRLWQNANIVTQASAGKVKDAIIACSGGQIVYAGPRAEAPAFDAAASVDCGGRWITPGLIDCHTHLVHAGHRAREFELRLAGASYEDIARAGGGIRSTMAATREASEDLLVSLALGRMDALLADGVTTVEVKSGYGLSLESEIKMLQAARRLARERGVTIVTSFLGAHAVPPEFDGRSDDYVDHVCSSMIPAIAALGLADAVDGFCESIAFSPAQIERIFETAKAHGLPVKLHAEQLSNSHGAALATRHGALSADHLEHADWSSVCAMGSAGTVAVLLPGAYYFTRETRMPPVDLLRRAGVPMAVATDCNPGTSPLTSLLLAMNMAATLFRLTVEECLAGVTANAARALGLADETGSIETGKRCDLAIWNIDDPAELVCNMGKSPLHARVWRGQ